MSFMRFLGLGLGDKVPDAKTIWLFRDTLTKANIMEALFAEFNRMLEAKNIITHKGTIVDATFVDAPRQRNSRKDNQTIKDGKIPEEWLADTPGLSTNWRRRMLMPVGPSKTRNFIMATKTMPKSMLRAKSSPIMR